VRHAVGLVSADVDVRAGEDRGHLGQHLLDQLEGRGQLRVEPHGTVLVAGHKLELDLVAAGVQLRVQPHERGRVPGRVDLGNDGDEAVRGVGDERPEVFVGVEGAGPRCPGRSAREEPPALVVGQVQVQHVELVEFQQVDHPPDLLDGEERAGQVERQTAPGIPRRVEDPGVRHADLPAAGGRCRGQQLDQRGQPAPRAGRLHRAHDDLLTPDHQRVPLVGRAAAGRCETHWRGERPEVVRGPKLDRDIWFVRHRLASHRREAQPRASCDLRAESPDHRRNGGIGEDDRRT
jgi:hypothetical protein